MSPQGIYDTARMKFYFLEHFHSLGSDQANARRGMKTKKRTRLRVSFLFSGAPLHWDWEQEQI